MEHSKFKDRDTFIDFLKQNGIPATPPNKADSVMLHWWEFEEIERFTDVAILNGYFFLAVIEQGFSLHVFDGYSNWYNYVHVWKSDEVSETEFLIDLKSIISNDIYSTSASKIRSRIPEPAYLSEKQINREIYRRKQNNAGYLVLSILFFLGVFIAIGKNIYTMIFGLLALVLLVYEIRNWLKYRSLQS